MQWQHKSKVGHSQSNDTHKLHKVALSQREPGHTCTFSQRNESLWWAHIDVSVLYGKIFGHTSVVPGLNIWPRATTTWVASYCVLIHCLVVGMNTHWIKKCYCWNKINIPQRKSATEKPDQQKQRLARLRRPEGPTTVYSQPTLPHPNLVDYLLACCSLRLAPQSHDFGLVYICTHS